MKRGGGRLGRSGDANPRTPELSHPPPPPRPRRSSSSAFPGGHSAVSAAGRWLSAVSVHVRHPPPRPVPPIVGAGRRGASALPDPIGSRRRVVTPFSRAGGGRGRGLRSRVGWAASPLAGGMPPSSPRAASPRAQALRSALSLARSARPCPRVAPEWLEEKEGGPNRAFPALSLAEPSRRAGALRCSRTTIGYRAVNASRLDDAALRAPAGPRPPAPLPGASRRPEVRGGARRRRAPTVHGR